MKIEEKTAKQLISDLIKRELDVAADTCPTVLGSRLDVSQYQLRRIKRELRKIQKDFAE